MKNEMELELEGYDLNYEITPFGYDGKNTMFCELKLSFETSPEKMIDLLKLYKKVSDIQKHDYSEDENGDPIFLTDVYGLKLKFLRIEEDE